MEDKSKTIIAISRQLGSGGAYIGQKMAEKMNILYLDREILINAANNLSTKEEELEFREEKLPSFWGSMFNPEGYRFPDAYIPPKMLAPTEGELFRTESEIIKNIAQEKSAVIVGRCSAQILCGYPNVITIFLYADIKSRIKRVKEIYDVSEEEAIKMIAKSDKERARYIHAFAEKDMTDAREYDLSLDTGKIGLDNCVKIILNYIGMIK